MSTSKVCRHCGELFTLPSPPAKTFGRFINECRECSDSLYRGAASTDDEERPDVNPKTARYRAALKRSLVEKGWAPSRIAEFLQSVENLEEF